MFSNHIKVWLRMFSVVALMFATAPSFAQENKAVTSEKVEEAMKVVESKHVCMVNDTYFARDQIPVQVGEETYYGCCAMCKQTLTENEEVRKAVDPVSGKSVDKAKAVIGAEKNGKVHYFESLANLKKFQTKEPS